MSRIKILVVVRALQEGGISRFVERTYTKLNQKKFEITIMALSEKYNQDLYDDLIAHNLKIKIVSSLTQNPYLYFKTINKDVTDYYDVLHMHTDNWVNFYPLMVAKKRRVKKIIVQSHNSNNHFVASSKIKTKINNWAKKNSFMWVTDKIAVSKEARQWMFQDDDEVRIMTNPVEIKKFKFSIQKRKKIREMFSIGNNVLFGNVARFDEQKNPLFLLEIFYYIFQQNHAVKLMLIGSGPLKLKLRKKIKEYHLENNVIIVEWTENIEDFYSAMDEIIFPSVYEGFPLSLIEAQCSGIPIIYSDTVTDEVEVLDNVVSESLNKAANLWAMHALRLYGESGNLSRSESYKEMIKNGFDYSEYIKKLENIYKQV